MWILKIGCYLLFKSNVIFVQRYKRSLNNFSLNKLFFQKKGKKQSPQIIESFINIVFSFIAESSRVSCDILPDKIFITQINLEWMIFHYLHRFTTEEYKLHNYETIYGKR